MGADFRMIRRREFLQAGAAALAAGAAGCGRVTLGSGPRGTSPVAILKAGSYDVDLVSLMLRGAAALGLQARGKRVLLKPNLVEFARGSVIHTDVRVLAAAVELFERLGAAEIIIGEGPGHRRDALFLAGEAGYRSSIRNFDKCFVDLNRDDVGPVGPFAGH